MEIAKDKKILLAIKDYIDKAKAIKPEITNDMLVDNGAIYYANGNDGTEFDWSCNHRTCEFETYYNDGWGFVRAFLTDKGDIEGYIYDKSDITHGNKLAIEHICTPKEAKGFAWFLYCVFDRIALYDYKIDFSIFE